MKVVFVTESLGSGGAERQLIGLAAIFAQKGIECIVVTWVDKNFYASFLAENNVRHILLQPKCRFDRVKKLAAIFRKEKPDAVISFLPMANETCALASLISPVKLIVSERSFTTNWGLRRRLTNLLYRRAAYVVANSNNEAENIRKHCPRLAAHTVAIPNYVDVERFASDAVKTRNRGPLALIGVGRVIPSKNILNLLRALAKIKSDGIDFTFDWYGATYDKVYVSEVKKLISDLGLDNIFDLRGECKDIEQAYRDADIMCMPSMLEGYPNVLVEAMASGLPVVVSNVCEHPHIVKEDVNGFLFDPHDVNAIHAGLMKAIKLTASEVSVMAQENRRKVICNNSIESFSDKYLSLL